MGGQLLLASSGHSYHSTGYVFPVLTSLPCRTNIPLSTLAYRLAFRSQIPAACPFPGKLPILEPIPSLDVVSIVVHKHLKQMWMLAALELAKKRVRQSSTSRTRYFTRGELSVPPPCG
jgi:hypothetical protein